MDLLMQSTRIMAQHASQGSDNAVATRSIEGFPTYPEAYCHMLGYDKEGIYDMYNVPQVAAARLDFAWEDYRSPSTYHIIDGILPVPGYPKAPMPEDIASWPKVTMDSDCPTSPIAGGPENRQQETQSSASPLIEGMGVEKLDLHNRAFQEHARSVLTFPNHPHLDSASQFHPFQV